MSQIFRRYFAFFISGAAVFLAGAGSAAAADGQFYVLNYENAATSPRARVVSLTERLKRLTRQSLYVPKSQRTREIFSVLSDGKQQKIFTYRMDKRGNMRIVLPDSYQKLQAEPGSLPRLTGWYLLGHAGKNPDLEKHLRNSWFVVGLSRKVMGEMNSVRTPFAGYFPAAYTLTSVSRYPTLQSLLETPLTPEDTAPRLIYEEYCELLVMICARNGLFRAGLLYHLLDDFGKKPQRRDMPELFRMYTRTILEKRAPKIFKAGVIKTGLKEAYEIWFRKELDELLNYSFLPASTEKIENTYLKTVRFEGQLKIQDEKQKKKANGKNKPDGEKSAGTIRGGLAELAANYRKLETPETIVSDIIGRLARLLQMLPPDLKIPLSNVRNALQTFSGAPSTRNGKSLLKAEQDFFRALENHLVLEKFLSETEISCVSPAARYYMTFSLIDFRRQPDQQPMKSLTELLERTGGENGK